MLKRKITGLWLSLLLLLGISGTAFFAAPLSAYAEEPSLPQPSSVELTPKNAELFLPESYEQYLPLVKPSYVAMNAKYIAIADGTALYIYNRIFESYLVYDVAQDTKNSDISKIQLSDDSRLFFSADLLLYEYHFEPDAPKRVTIVDNVPCNTFLVYENFLYTSNISAGTVTLSRYPLSNLNYEAGVQIATQGPLSVYSKLTAWNGILYCVRGDSYLVKYDISLMDKTPTKSQIGQAAFVDPKEAKIANLQRVCFFDDYLYFTVNGDETYPSGLYRSDMQNEPERLFEGKGFSSISAYDGHLYCIRNSSVLQIELTDGGAQFSGYEIASASSSPNRLAKAADAVRAGRIIELDDPLTPTEYRNLLVTADAGNRRVSVYNYVKQEYSYIPCDFTPAIVATDGETIAVSSGNDIYTCKYGETSFTHQMKTRQEVNGLVCIYGTVYYISEIEYGKIGEEGSYRSNYGTPQALTCDLYGTLFVTYKDGGVYRFNERTFLNGTGERMEFTLPSGYKCPRADFEGNLYYLFENTVYRNGAPFATVNGNRFVYNENTVPLAPTSFALGFEDDELYFFFDDFCVKSKSGTLDVPTLNKIDTGDITAQTFRHHGKADLLVEIPTLSIGVRTELSHLKTEDSEFFPYSGYFRLSDVKRGVLLGETERYYLVELTEGQSHTAALFLRDGNLLLPTQDYWEDGSGVKYLSNKVSSYYVPTLNTDLKELQLERGTEVEVFGYVTAPDRTYAAIRFTQGTQQTEGYVPASYLIDISPYPPEHDAFLSGNIKGSEEGIVLRADDGSSLTVTERTRAKLYKHEDGTYTATVVGKDGKTYSAHLEKSQLDWGETDILRISLIVILSALALIIIGLYPFLLPHDGVRAIPEDTEKHKR